MGSGKSFYAKQLSKSLAIDYIDLDVSIEKKYNSTIANIFEQHSEEYFRKIENETLLSTISSITTNTIIATGGGTPCFYNAITTMNQTGITIWLNESSEVIASKIYHEKNIRPLLDAKNIAEINSTLYNLLQIRQPVYQQCKYKLCNSEINIENLEKIIRLYV